MPGKTIVIINALLLLVYAQVPAQTPSLCLRILNYCEYITQQYPNKNTIIKMFTGYQDIKPDTIASMYLENRQDSLFTYYKKTDSNIETPYSFSLLKMKDTYMVEANFYGPSNYKITTSQNQAQLMADSPNRISFKEMKYYWGKPIPNSIQTKETYDCHFIYTNPLTGRQAIIKVGIYNVPANSNNDMDYIYIINSEFDKIKQ